MPATSFAEVRTLLASLGDSPEVRGTFSYGQILEHCAQSTPSGITKRVLEYSMTACPELRSAVFRATIGRVAKAKFLRQGFMQHDLDAPIAGALPLDPQGNVAKARERLLAAICSTDELAPHLAFGKCTREEYEKIHSMHIAEHLTRVGA